MGTISQLLSEKDLNLMEKHKANHRVQAGKIFSNMVKVATKRKLMMQLDGNRIKKIRIYFKSLGGFVWFTPYIHNDKLYLAHDWFVASGKDVFGPGVNRV